MRLDILETASESLKSLEALNLFLADVRDGVSPDLSVYINFFQNWTAATSGAAVSALAIAIVIAQTPAGAIVNNLCQKSLRIVAAVFVLLGCISSVLLSSFPTVVAAQVLINIGARLSNLVAGVGVDEARYNVGFLMLAAVLWFKALEAKTQFDCQPALVL